MKILKNKKYSILKTILRYSFAFAFAFSLLITTSVFAVTGDGIAGGDSNTPAGGDSNTSINIQTGINNPLEDGLDDIPAFIEKILEIVLTVGIPIVTLAIIYSGFLFVKAQGNPEELKKAKDTLKYTLIGAVLLLGAWVLADAIGSTVEEIKRTT